MTVKAKTEYTKELILKFSRFNSYKNKSQIIFYIIIELFMLSLVAFSIYMGITTKNTEDITVAIIFSIILPFIVPLLLIFLPVLAAKSNKNILGAVNIYEFSDDEIIIESTLPTSIGKSNTKYSAFKILYETRDYFYMYTSNQQAFIMRKSDITDGTLTDLQNLFRKNLPSNKYIVK